MSEEKISSLLQDITGVTRTLVALEHRFSNTEGRESAKSRAKSVVSLGIAILAGDDLGLLQQVVLLNCIGLVAGLKNIGDLSNLRQFLFDAREILPDAEWLLVRIAFRDLDVPEEWL